MFAPLKSSSLAFVSIKHENTHNQRPFLLCFSFISFIRTGSEDMKERNENGRNMFCGFQLVILGS
jgi:hypothetical protein